MALFELYSKTKENKICTKDKIKPQHICLSIRMYAVLTSKAKYIRDSIDMGSPRVFISIVNDSKKI